MKRLPVESSNIKAIGYHKKSKILEVEFNHGGIYCYSDVPGNAVEALFDADSVGKFFNTNIKNTFNFKRGVYNEKDNQIQSS